MTRMDALQAEPLSPEIDDPALARRVMAGDTAAFELVMRRHNRRLYRVARAMLRNGADAEDALQDAYLAAFQSMGNFRGESSLATWLSRVVVNQCLGRLRRQARRDNIVPMVSMETESTTGTARPVRAKASSRPNSPALTFRVSCWVSRKRMSAPPSIRPMACSA